jgi:hypothetical protein
MILPMRNWVAALLLTAAATAALAQVRSIPEDAKRGEMRHVQGMTLEIDGKPYRLAPGGQIRDASNMIVLPTAVPPGALVKYLADDEGVLRRAWILTPEEAAQRDKR